MIDIVSVTGHADTFDLVFIRGPDKKWAVTVPPDLSDGRYVCDIYATNAIGEIAYWTGILYMTDSRFVYLNLVQDNITVHLLPETQTIQMKDERVSISLRRRCA
ncbi:MAG: PF13754 domain-containing protein [Eubacteriales bacterium]